MSHLASFDARSKPQQLSIQTPIDASQADTANPLDDHEEDSQSQDDWWNEAVDSTLAEHRSVASSRMTQWPSAHNQSDMSPNNFLSQIGHREHSQEDSTYRPTRSWSMSHQKQRNLKPDIKVDTDFSEFHRHSPRPQPSVGVGTFTKKGPQDSTLGMFIDLAALQTLDNDDSTGRQPRKKNLPTKTIGNRDIGLNYGNDPSQLVGYRNRTTGAPGSETRETVKSLSPVSPDDRPIMIGLSIPSARLAVHVTDPQTAISECADIQQCTPSFDFPETPTIVITPAQAPSYSGLKVPGHPRVASSIYSRATHTSDIKGDITPVEWSSSQSGIARGMKHRDSANTIFDDEISPVSPAPVGSTRVTSSCTIFEEETSGPGFSPTNTKHTSISPLDHRASRGWWNYITTPFLSRSSTFASGGSAKLGKTPPLPSLNTAAIKALPNSKNKRNQEKSAFSPITPYSSTTIASDTWWESRNTVDCSPKPDPIRLSMAYTYRTHDSQEGTLPFMMVSNGTIRTAREQSGEFESMPLPIAGQGDVSTRTLIDASVREASVMFDISNLGIQNVEASHFQNHDHTQEATSGLSSGHREARRMEARSMAQERLVTLHDNTRRSKATPPPYSPPRSRYHAIFPPGHRMNATATNTSNTTNMTYVTSSSMQQPHSPEPLSPGLVRATATPNAIPMSEVPLTPMARRPINLDSAYANASRDMPITSFEPPPRRALKAERQRKRYEKEDRIVHRTGGLWRGRGCVSNSGCYGRKGAEGRKRRRCWFGLIIGFLIMIILIVVLATQLHHKSSSTLETQWLNLTGFPPIFTGISTVSGAGNTIANSGCVFPATMWSCDLPKEIQTSGSDLSSPNFRFQIQWDNSTAANLTFANITGDLNLRERSLGNDPVTARHFIRRMISTIRSIPIFEPTPAPPSYAEEFFLGNTTDGTVSASKAGEATPFYISLLSTTSGLNNGPTVLRRSDSSFPNISSLIPAASTTSDGSPAPANILPLPFQQPIRLYDRGLVTEHYGFYSYFDRSIFLASTSLNTTGSTDLNGGSTLAAARYRCTWSQTRLLIQIWTRKDTTAVLFNSTSQSNYLASSSNYTAAVANDFTAPGSFPYPVTVKTDRHGGAVEKKMIYCYDIDGDGRVDKSSGQLWLEHRGNGGNGVVINPAPTLFSGGGNDTEGGYDGGNTGCECAWQNWKGVVAG